MFVTPLIVAYPFLQETLLYVFRDVPIKKLGLEVKDTPYDPEGTDPYIDYICEEEHDSEDEDDRGEDEEEEIYFRQVNMETLAHDIARVAPELRSISLSFSETSDTTFHWSISRDPLGAVTLSRLASADEEIMKESNFP